jgi:alkylation response protein AidB-like acyl-CoA dehydrogenase
MNFGFSEEQEMLRESAERFLESECPPSFVRKMMDDATAHSSELWKKLAALGWLGLLVPQRLGGMGGSLLDAVVVLEETGKALLPGPFFATLCAGVAIALCGSPTQRRRLLPRIAEGSLTATLAFLDESPRRGRAGTEVHPTRKRGDWVLRGEKRFVLDAAAADVIVVAARTSREKPGSSRGVTLFLVERDAPGLGVVPLRTVDRTRRQASLVFDGVSLSAADVLGRVDAAGPALDRTLSVATAGLCAETVGVAQRAFDLSLRYATERRQFGRPIGGFQAVKHKCVDMMIGLESARSLGYYAAWAVERRSRDRVKALAMAKAYTSDIGKSVTGEAIQLHGGIGFTWEHDVHLYYRRALANEAMFGSAPLHRETVARELAL